jgi:uncharacterized membrane-anchored protein YhcB (DUF1043 family)
VALSGVLGLGAGYGLAVGYELGQWFFATDGLVVGLVIGCIIKRYSARPIYRRTYVERAE